MKKILINNTLNTIKNVLVIVHRLCRCLYMVPEKWVPCRFASVASVGVIQILGAVLQNPVGQIQQQFYDL
jgi:hypothetical protein